MYPIGNAKINHPVCWYFYLLSLAICCFSCKRIQTPTISIFKENNISWTEKTKCNLTYSEGTRQENLSGKIKFRGGYSSRYYKHSFTVKLEEKLSMGGLPKDDDWVLNASYIDKTFMRHKISYDIFREMHPDNMASQSAYINLNLNNNYEGLYVLMQKMNKGLIGLNKNDSMAMLFKDPPIFYKDRLSYAEDSWNYYEQKFPKITKVDYTPFLDQFKTFLFYSDDKEFAANIQYWVDIRNVIDWHLILLFSNNGDGVLKNFYLYKLDHKTPFRFAIWDYDHSYGRDGDNEKNLMKSLVDCNRSILLKRLLEIEEIGYTTQLKKRYQNLRGSGIFSIANFERHIDENNSLIESNLAKNFEKWPLNSKWYYDDNGYEEEVKILGQFIRLRINYLDQYFEQLDV